MIILIPILVAVAIFGLVLGLFSGRGEDSDLQDKRMDAIRNVDKDAEDEKKRKEKVKISQRIKNIKNRKQEKNAKISMKKKDDRKKKSNIVDDMLVMVQIDMTSQQFSVLKLCVSCIAMFIAFLLCIRLHVSVKTLLIALLIAGLLGFVLPAEILKSKVKKYQESIRLELPEIMDLLVVSVEAGLGFDAALMRLYEKNQSILMEELMQATRDIQRGVSKKEAYNDLAKRCKVKELSSFLTAMIQADQMGTSIKTVLKTQSESLRVSRARRAAKKAKEAPIKMLLPMVGLIFPVIFIILLVPAILNIMNVM